MEKISDAFTEMFFCKSTNDASVYCIWTARQPCRYETLPRLQMWLVSMNPQTGSVWSQNHSDGNLCLITCHWLSNFQKSFFLFHERLYRPFFRTIWCNFYRFSLFGTHCASHSAVVQSMTGHPMIGFTRNRLSALALKCSIGSILFINQ